MKKQLLPFLLLTFIIGLTSCDKNDDLIELTCSEAQYNERITVSDNTAFCFPDGQEIQVLSLINAFCPCNVMCIWEGQLSLQVRWIDADGVETTGILGTHPTVDSDQDEGFTALNIITDPDWNLEFEVECSDAVPSPKVLSAEIMVVQ